MRLGSLFLLPVLGLILTGAASAATFIALGPGADETGELVGVDVINQSTETITLDYQLSGFVLDQVTIDGQTYYQVNLGNESKMLTAGSPELPDVSRSVIIPDQLAMRARVVDASYQEFSDIDVVPSKGNLTRDIDPTSVPYEFGSVYQQDGYYPGELVEQGDPYILRDYRGMVLTINPIQYNPATHTLRVYESVQIEIEPMGVGSINTINRATGTPDHCHPEFDKLYASHFINYQGGFARYAPIDEIGEMIVIALDAYGSAMQPLVDWRNQMGIPTTLFLKSEVGSSATEIDAFIQNYFDSHDLAFVLLVGNSADIPSYQNGGAPADPVYALVAGSDNYPDIFVGRFAADNISQVALQVEKTVEYEFLAQEAVTWYHKGIGIGSEQGAGIGDDGEADWQHIDNIRADLLNFTYTEVDQLYAIYGATAAQVANAVNEGRSFINYCGHGSTTSWSTTGFSVAHINALTNFDKLPFIVSVACVNGAFQHTGTCFAEAWMWAEQAGYNTGAIGIYASTVNMSWAPPMSSQDETTDLLVAEEKRAWGTLCFSGSCQMIDDYGSSGISEFKNWHVFGDPALRVRTDEPAELAVTYDEVIEPAATTYPVTVTGVAGALCGLSNNGEYLGSAFTDASGYAEIVVVGDLPEDTVSLTVTYFNSHVFTAELNVGEPLIPTLVLDPTEFTCYVPLGETHVEYLNITNLGMEGSMLEYSLAVSPLMIHPWVTFTPSSGEVGYNETDVIEVTIDTEGLEFGTHEAGIAVNSNAGRALVPITLITAEYSDAQDRSGLPARLFLAPATPNPLQRATTITFGLPQASEAHVGVYDTNGRLVRTLASGAMEAGYHNLTWDGLDTAGNPTNGGVYFYTVNSDHQSLSGKVMVLR